MSIYDELKDMLPDGAEDDYEYRSIFRSMGFPVYETIELGVTPCDEDCVQFNDRTGYGDRHDEARAEADRHVKLLRQFFDFFPSEADVQFKVTSNSYGFSSYFDVAVKYDENDALSYDTALFVESNSPQHWYYTIGQQWEAHVKYMKEVLGKTDEQELPEKPSEKQFNKKIVVNLNGETLQVLPRTEEKKGA